MIGITILFFIFGMIVGSFINVLILRLNTGKGIGGRSHCFSCRAQLRWFELVPVFSFLIQRGRCRHCGAKIRSQYIIVELLTGIIFGSLAIKFLVIPFGWSLITILVIGIISVLAVAISVYDLRHMIVPDVFVIPFLIISFLSLFISVTDPAFAVTGNIFVPLLWRFLAGIIVSLPFLITWWLSKGRLMGFGDIKIMVGMGWLLGLWGGISAVVLAFWIALGWSICIWVFQHSRPLFINAKHFIIKLFSGNTHKQTSMHYKHIDFSTQVPFAPFLFIGCYVVLVCGVTLFPFFVL